MRTTTPVRPRPLTRSRLPFVTALQLLPPQQRVVLILCDVLDAGVALLG